MQLPHNFNSHPSYWSLVLSSSFSSNPSVITHCFQLRVPRPPTFLGEWSGGALLAFGNLCQVRLFSVGTDCDSLHLIFTDCDRLHLHLLRNGPAQLSFNGNPRRKFTSWLDGFAKLHSFKFSGSKVPPFSYHQFSLIATVFCSPIKLLISGSVQREDVGVSQLPGQR